jgi:hypothetical protein
VMVRRIHLACIGCWLARKIFFPTPTILPLDHHGHARHVSISMLAGLALGTATFPLSGVRSLPREGMVLPPSAGAPPRPGRAPRALEQTQVEPRRHRN